MDWKKYQKGSLSFFKFWLIIIRNLTDWESDMIKTGTASRRDSWFLGLSLFFILLVTPGMVFLVLGLLLFLLGCILEKKKLPMEKRDLLLGLFIIGAILSGLFSKNPASSAPTALAFAIYVLAMWYGRGGNFTEEAYTRAIRLLAGGVIFFSVLLLIHQFIIRKDIVFQLFGSQVKFPYNSGQLDSFLPFSTGGGYLLSILWLWLWGYAVARVRTMSWKERAFVGIALVLSAVIVFLTVARAGMLMMAVGAFVSLLFYKWGRRLVLVMAAIGVIGAGTFLVQPKLIEKTPLASYFSPHKQRNLRSRFSQLTVGWDVYKKSNPVLGIGLMNFGPVYNERPERADGDLINYLHNSYLAVLVETGALGFLLFFSYLVIVSIRLVKQNLKRRTPVSLSAISVLAGFWVTGLVEVAILYVVYTGVLFWLLLGLADNPLLNGEASKALDSKSA